MMLIGDDISDTDLETLHTIASQLYEKGEDLNRPEAISQSKTLAKIGSSFGYGPSLNLLGVHLSNEIDDPAQIVKVKRVEEIFKAACDLGESDAAYNLALFYRDIGRYVDSKLQLYLAREMGHQCALEQDDHFNVINDNFK